MIDGNASMDASFLSPINGKSEVDNREKRNILRFNTCLILCQIRTRFIFISVTDGERGFIRGMNESREFSICQNRKIMKNNANS